MKTRETEMDKNYHDIYECWKEFVTTGKISDPSPVREIILESWKRSRDYGLNPYTCKKVIRDLDELLKENKQFIDVAVPHMELIHNFVIGSGFVVILIDKDGYILKIIGDLDVIEKAYENNLTAGANRSEDYTGTNAISLALKSQMPIQMVGPEHYSVNFHEWTCSCAPIKNSAGELLGALNLSGHFSLLHKHTLGLVVAAVRAIERELYLIEAHKKAVDTSMYLEAVNDSVADGLLTVSPDGDIVRINSRARIILGREVKKLTELFEPNSDLHSLIINGQGFLEKEYFCKMNSNYCLMTAKSIIGTRDQVIGFLLIIKEKKKVHNLVNRMVGSTANFTFQDIIGESKAIKECIELAKTAARTDCKVLLEGESGTGKELFAQGIHNFSNRNDGPFIGVNCSALPRELVESELFGYEEGAFSGANKKGKPGRFELADGGTLFLDEVSTISLDMQAKLLRVLQENRIMRLGGINSIPLNVRLVAATNKDLTELIEENSFREDLYYRLSVFTLKIPPLRERKEDIPQLVDYFCRKHEGVLVAHKIEVSPQFIDHLMPYHWPGNIRELENVIEKAVIISKGFLTSPEFLPDRINKSFHIGADSNDALELIKEKAIKVVLEQTNGNITKAAKILGVSRNTIYSKIKNKAR